jgi:two-component sensor histidine kinase
LIALSCTLPVAIFGGYFAYYFVSEASEQQKADFDERLSLMRNAVDRRMAKIIAELQVLGYSPDLQSGDLIRFRAHAIETAKLIGALTVLLCDYEGNQILNTRPLPPGGSYPKREHIEALRQAAATGQPTVSDVYPAAVDGKLVISVEVPVQVGGQRYILAAGIVSTTFSDLMNEYVPDDAIGSIIDRNGVLIARKPLQGGREVAGTKTIPEVLQHIGEPSASWIPATSRSGQPTYTSMLRSSLTGWSVNLALPREAIDAPVRWTILFFSGMGLLAVGAGLLLARLVSLRFVRAFAVLQDHAQRLALRRPSQPENGPIAEINVMDQTLYQVSNQLGEIMHRQEVLLAEINHRVKNTLATINAIVRLTRGSTASVPEFVENFQTRLFALGRAYDLLTRTDWSGANLRALIETTLAPYTRSNEIHVAGPDVVLRPKLALAMAAAIQELTTNAAKYGALSDPKGQLDVQWEADPAGHVHFSWVERNGPPAAAPTRSGFGTRLIQEVLAKDTGWTVEVDYAASGLQCRITMRDVTRDRPFDSADDRIVEPAK